MIMVESVLFYGDINSYKMAMPFYNFIIKVL